MEAPANLSLNILHLEDSPEDAELVRRAIKRDGIDCSITRVERREEFERALDNDWDLIIADYSLPYFDGESALAIAANRCPSVPFIFVSGTLGEEIAIEALKRGATDYVIKERLVRLGPAVRRAVAEAGQRRDAEGAQAQLRLWSKVFECSNEAIFITDARNRFVEVNRAFCEATGYQPEEVLGKNPQFLASGRHGPEFYQQMWQSLLTNGYWRGEIWDRRKNGEVYPEWLSITSVPGPDGTVANWIGSFSDITERKRNEEKIEHLAHHDHLTGLPNRLLFYDLLGNALAHARRTSGRVALLFVDLDRFKTINDSLGHHFGDSLLREASGRIATAVRDEDTVCRLSGDEFLILLSNIRHPDDVTRVARILLGVLGRRFLIGGLELRISASIGISIYPEDGSDADSLIKAADSAMYNAKESGRNSYRFFVPELNERSFELLTLENKLRRGLEVGEFVLLYQPQVDLASGTVTGVEALIRWRDGGGYVPPDRFIALAEATGLIIPIGEWVIGEACRQHQQWVAAGLPAVSMAVNISPLQFHHGNLNGIISDALARTGIDPAHLEVELTEGILMKEVESTEQALHQLKEMGIHVALDDFGTGYSSLSYLRRFPIDKLKVDQSFVRDIDRDSTNLAILDAIIQLGQSLQMKVIAEGVETPEVYRLLQARGCDAVQGFHFCHPMTGPAFADWMRSR